MEIMYPNYKRSLLNISQSILKGYGLATNYVSIKEIDDILKTNPNHVMVILLDGLGVNVLEQNLSAMAALRKQHVTTLTSVFPPTTAAATSSFLSGQLPRTNGRIGWMQYDQQTKINTVIFRNQDYYDPTHKELESNFPDQISYVNIFQKIKNVRSDVVVEELWPEFRPDGYISFNTQVDRLIEISKTNIKTLNYAYWTNPDDTIHRHGVNSLKTKEVVEHLNAEYQRLINNVGPDTVIILFADHGLINVRPLNFVNKPKFKALLSQPPSLEARSCTFFLKEGKNKEFLEYYNNYLKNHFLLIPGNQYFSTKLFGTGPDHPLLHTFIGDYILVATDDYYIELLEEKEYAGHHAGLTREEMEIPLIIYESNKP